MTRKPMHLSSAAIDGHSQGLCQELRPGADRTGMLAVVADPSCFSLPYDYSLCHALHAAGCGVMLARSNYLYDQWEPARTFASWNGFYEVTHGLGRKHSRRWVWKLAKGAEHVFSMKHFGRELRNLKPDVIHFQWLPVPVLDRLFLPSLARIAPLVLTLHDTNFSRSGLMVRWQQETGIRSVFKHLSALIVHSKFSKQRVLENRWMPQEKVYVVPHGPLEYYHAVKSQPAPLVSSEPVILFFGRIEHSKGVDFLLRAFAALPPGIMSQTRLVIAGKPGRTIESLRMLSTKLGIDHRVTWDLRFVAEKEVPSLFQSASVIVLPYREIDQSGVLMTAIAFGKPIIATRVGGIPETVQDRVHGFLVRPGDIPQLTQALHDILGDPERKAGMEKAVQRLRTGSLSWTSSAEKTLEIYRRLAYGDSRSAIAETLSA